MSSEVPQTPEPQNEEPKSSQESETCKISPEQDAATISTPTSATPYPSLTKISKSDPDPGSQGDLEPECEEQEDPLVIDEVEEKSEAGESDEKDFEPTVEMMINDFDDERTLEEEEALQQDEDEGDELAALEQEQDMPLEDLLKLYNYGGNQSASSPGKKSPVPPERLRDVRPDKQKQDKNCVLPLKLKSVEPDVQKPSSDVEDVVDETPKGEKRRNADSPLHTQSAKKSKSELARFYEATVEGRALRSTSGGQTDEIDEEESEGEDSEHEGRDYSWRKTIMIGPSYQAAVPADMCAYGDTLPYENEDKKLWDPNTLWPEEVEGYLAKSDESLHMTGVAGLPHGAHIRDDEQALFLLLQCGYNCEEALRRWRLNALPSADTMSLWSEEECRAFELGLRLYGKDFHMIHQQKVRTRSVGELVQFYYLWKKTERHDVFANATRLEKKKYTLHPGTTDYMDRFIDDQDQSRDRSSSPTYHSLIFTDNKKGLSLHPGATRSPGVSNGNNPPSFPSSTAITTSTTEISHTDSNVPLEDPPNA